MLKKVAAIGFQTIIDELEDKIKATYKYLCISGTEFLYKHCPEDVKKAMLGKMVSNNLAKSSFAGVAAQVQCYGCISTCNTADVSDTARNGFLNRPTKKRRISRPTAKMKQPAKEKKRGLLHGLLKELQITLTMTAIEDALKTTKSNNDDLEQARAMQLQKEELMKERSLEDIEDELIESLVYHRMWDLDACWKTIVAITAGLKRLKY